MVAEINPRDGCFAAVVVDLAGVDGVFDFHVPSDLRGRIAPGSLVIVPFGARKVYGIVTQLRESSLVQETKAVEAVLDERPVLTSAQIALAGILSQQYLIPLSTMTFAMLPPGLSQQADVLYTWVGGEEVLERLGEGEKALVHLLLRRGPLRGRQIDAALPYRDWRTAAKRLIRRKWLRGEPVLPPPTVRPKIVRTAQLACTPQEAEEAMPHLGKRGSAALARRQAILRFLIQEPWPVDVPWLYAVSGGTLDDLVRLAEMGLIRLGETEVWRDPLEKLDVQPEAPLNLTSDQQRALEAITLALRDAEQRAPPPYLLFGVTGSGKTEIYLRAVEEALRQGKQAIVLVPEIALTPQTVRRFVARFPGRVGIIHSRLSPGERYDTWRRARDGRISVVIGPRTALFTPFERLGLIVVDECHEPSYYQTESPPYYHAVQAAIHYARLTRSVLLLGTATPEVALFYRAQEENWPILRLPERVRAHREITSSPPLAQEEQARTSGASLPLVRIVDMRQELKAGNRSIFSRALIEALERVVSAGQQAILFLNRLGSATYVFCRECGYVLKCPRCDIPLTLHHDPAGLMCHRCGYRRQMPSRCPECGSKDFREYGLGTERVEQELYRLLPGVRALRWDSVAVQQKDSHEIILRHFSNHQADVLIGTQMLAKGLDLPLVTLVGVVLADVGLNLPEFRAAERTFQLLSQVAGRAGRSPLGGEVIFQTFHPEHYAIQFAARHDYEGFYRHELNLRRMIGYPPFSRLVRLEYRHGRRDVAEHEAQKMASTIREWMAHEESGGCEVLGPLPCFYARLNGQYRWQIILRGTDPVRILQGRSLKSDWRVEVDPPSLL